MGSFIFIAGTVGIILCSVASQCLCCHCCCTSSWYNHSSSLESLLSGLCLLPALNDLKVTGKQLLLQEKYHLVYLMDLHDDTFKYVIGCKMQHGTCFFNLEFTLIKWMGTFVPIFLFLFAMFIQIPLAITRVKVCSCKAVLTKWILSNIALTFFALFAKARQVISIVNSLPVRQQ